MEVMCGWALKGFLFLGGAALLWKLVSKNIPGAMDYLFAYLKRFSLLWAFIVRNKAKLKALDEEAHEALQKELDEAE